MMLNEILDKPQGQLLEWKWNQDAMATEVLYEMQAFREAKEDLPHW